MREKGLAGPPYTNVIIFRLSSHPEPSSEVNPKWTGSWTSCLHCERRRRLCQHGLHSVQRQETRAGGEANGYAIRAIRLCDSSARERRGKSIFTEAVRRTERGRHPEREGDEQTHDGENQR